MPYRWENELDTSQNQAEKRGVNLSTLLSTLSKTLCVFSMADNRRQANSVKPLPVVNQAMRHTIEARKIFNKFNKKRFYVL